ncbi:MAG: Ldh family oxidoreductase [Chloroflexi bacterium]|nr:Ldh family oxidoreductase [Chloroflexota bacterium]
MTHILVPEPTLRQIGVELFVSAGLSAEHAETVTRVQVEADLRGIHSHGMRAVPTYLTRIDRGIVNPRPTVRVVHATELSAVVDGDAGPGQVVAVRAMEECLARARRRGFGLAVARNSNHFGAAAYYAMMALPHDLIGFATTNGNLVLAPWGGVRPTVGNNPLAYAIPAGEEWPIVLDIAMSVAAGGKVDLAAAEGHPLPAGWAINSAGQPTRDPAAARRGQMLPLGAPAAGYKGFGLALVMEALAGALAGARFALQHTAEVEDGELPWDEGHFFLALDPALIMPVDEFKRRVDRLIRDCQASPPAPGEPPVRVPGAGGWLRRERALREGIPLPASVYRSLQRLTRERGTATRF